MLNDFTADYSARSDDELLMLASDRPSLTTEAATALDAELHRRNLTESDRLKYERFVKVNERREAKSRRKRIFGTKREDRGWAELFWALLIIAVISFTYLALPSQYRFRPDWQEAAMNAMFTSVFIVVYCRSWLRRIGFWLSLALSSAMHVVIVHAWLKRVGQFSRGEGKLAVLLGGVLFFAVYGSVWLLRRSVYGKEVPQHS